MATSIVRGFGDGRYTVALGDYEIHTTLTALGNELDSWLDDIYGNHRRRLVAGLGVQWRPPTKRGMGEPPVAVLQICVGCRCLVFQILRANHVPDSLFDFLADSRFTFVGVGINDDVARLRARYGLEVENAVDLRHLAAKSSTLWQKTLPGTTAKHPNGPGLRTLAREVARLEMPLDVRVSAWDQPRLSLEQLQFACADAFASFEVGRRLICPDLAGTRPARFRIYLLLKLIATIKSIVAIAILFAMVFYFRVCRCISISEAHATVQMNPGGFH